MHTHTCGCLCALAIAPPDQALHDVLEVIESSGYFDESHEDVEEEEEDEEEEEEEEEEDEDEVA